MAMLADASSATLGLPSDIAGASIGPIRQSLDARWLMAYAAALGETAPAYFDTTRAEGIAAHPLFPVCWEWPLWTQLHRSLFAPAVLLRGVHATHDLVLHQMPRAGDTVLIHATIASVTPHRAGSRVVTRFDTTNEEGAAVSTTYAASIYRGVSCAHDGATDAFVEPVSESSVTNGDADVCWSRVLPVSAGLAHVYSECARIWNPIHTDRIAALAADLPDIVLHGTASLALAVGEVLRQEAVRLDRAVARIRCRFRGMVRLPSSLTIEGLGTIPSEPRTFAFRVRDAAGRIVVDAGLLSIAG